MPLFEAPADLSLADPLPESPLPLLARWLEEAREGGVLRNPTAMTLATVAPDGNPSARVLLCRGFDEARGALVFYTDRGSRKGVELTAHPRAAAVFHWDALERQVRIEGPVDPLADSESDAWFASRPRAAQIAAWASAQSRPVSSRQALLDQMRARQERFAGEPEAPIPRPPDWVGYQLCIETIEFWVGAAGRAHDRALWTRVPAAATGGFAGAVWSVVRLQP